MRRGGGIAPYGGNKISAMEEKDGGGRDGESIPSSVGCADTFPKGKALKGRPGVRPLRRKF